MKKSEDWKPTKLIQDGDNWAPNPDKVGPWSFHAVSLQAKVYPKIIQDHSRGKMLDFGAGTVPYWGIYKDLVDETVCTDWGESPHELIHIDQMVDAGKKLPFKDSEFDTVLLADVMEHLSNPESFIKELGRVTNKNGKVIIFVPFIYWLHEDPYDYFRYTKYSLKNLAKQNGFDTVLLEEYGGGPDVLLDIIHKMTGKKRYFFVVKRLSNLYLRTKSYKKSQAKRKVKFPLGYVCVMQKR